MTGQRAVRLLNAVLVTGAGLLALRLWSAAWPSSDALLVAALVAVGFYVADAYPLHVENRGQTISVSLSEVPLVLGLLFCRPELLIAARLLGAASSLILKRRQTVQKLLFNLSSFAFEAALAATVFVSVSGHDHADLQGAGLAVVLAAASAAVSTASAVTLAIRLATGHWERGPFRALVRTGLLELFVACCAGVLFAAAVHSSDGEVIPAAVVAGALYAAYRAHLDLRHRHDNLALLYAFTANVDPAASYGRRLRELLLRTREALRSGHAEVVLTTPEGATRHWVGADGRLVTSAADFSDLAVLSLVQAGGPCRVPRLHGGSSAAARHSHARGWRDALMVPLTLTGDATGMLVVADRLSDVVSFTPDDVRVLTSVAVQVTQALVGGELLDRLTRESRQDTLTGLANRTNFQERLREAVEEGTPFAVLLMDLDRFKEVNDTLGHHHGDLLIREVAARLLAAAPTGATVARLGGDEFAVLLPTTEVGTAAAGAADLAAAVGRPCWIDDVSLDVQSSTGIALFPQHGDDPSVLLRRADTAMYAAKNAGRAVGVYELRSDEHSTRRLELTGRLRTAADDGALLLEYQPQVELATGRIVGVEALMRWQHPTLGLVSPAEFIPLAEQSGAIAELSMWALTEALGQAARWRDAGRPLQVSVNLSMRNLLDTAVTRLLETLMRSHALDPGSVTVEVTESQIMAEPERTARTLQRLSRLGVGVSIDDFGTGYSALAYLRQLPVDELKIDRSFMQGLADGGQQGAIVRAVVELARSLDMNVVAEGVEDLPTLRQLTAMGCGRAQGFLFARSMPAAEVLPWIAAQEPLLLEQISAATRPAGRLPRQRSGDVIAITR